MFGYCPKGEDLRQEYLVVLSELVEALKQHGKFHLKTRFIARRSEVARLAWDNHSRHCIACYRKVKTSSIH